MTRNLSLNYYFVGAILFFLSLFVLINLSFTFSVQAQTGSFRFETLPSTGCVRAGCSGQLCVPTSQLGAPSTCEYKDEYACYDQAICEMQTDGNCGFTITSEAQACLAELGILTPPPAISPSPSFSPTPIPSPSPVITAITPGITLGSSRPTDQELDYQTITLNEEPQIYSITEQDVAVQNLGYAKGFKFQAQQGQKLHLLAKELNLETNGSFISSIFYDVNGNKIDNYATRIQNYTVPKTGIYYWIIFSSQDKTGSFRLAAYDKEELNLKFYLENEQSGGKIELKDFSQNPLDTTFTGPFAIIIDFPEPVTIAADGSISWYNRLEDLIKYANILVSKDTNIDTINSYWNSSAGSYFATKVTYGDSNQQIIVKTDSDELFASGFYYLLKTRIFYPNNSSATGVDNKTTWSTVPDPNQPPSADLTNDGKVDIDDYSLLKQNLMRTTSSGAIGDVNKDGWIDLDDYTILKAQLSLF